MYLHLPWLGSISDRFAKQVSTAVRHCYFATNTSVVFSARPVLLSMRKDVLPPHHNSSLIYSFKCSCSLHYIGRTTQRLDVRKKQHVPAKIRNRKYTPSDILTNTYNSSIAEHLINSHNCSVNFSGDAFTILSKSHSNYQLKVLETIYILSLKPPLCKQKDFILGLQLITV